MKLALLSLVLSLAICVVPLAALPLDMKDAKHAMQEKLKMKTVDKHSTHLWHPPFYKAGKASSPKDTPPTHDVKKHAQKHASSAARDRVLEIANRPPRTEDPKPRFSLRGKV